MTAIAATLPKETNPLRLHNFEGPSLWSNYHKPLVRYLFNLYGNSIPEPQLKVTML
jgi:hypothetical protein